MQMDLTKRLPAELLTMVFQAWKLSGHATEHGLVSEWVRATWVCKAWREVALDATVLWSSVLVSRRLADDPALEMQLDRAHGVALDLLVSCPQMSSAEVEEALSLVVSKTKIIKKLKIIYTEWEQRDVVEAFVKDVGAEVVSLSLLSDKDAGRSREWEFTPDIFPRLRHLTLDKIIPISRTPLLNLTQLEMAYAYDDPDGWESVFLPRYMYYVHKFLAACPNLETLRMVDCFLLPEHYNEQEQPVAVLPKLRYLSMADSVFEVSKALKTLRLPPSSSFHITADSEGDVDCDCTILIIPRNVSESLPAIRRTRCLSLIVGQHPPSHLSLRGGPGDNFEDESDWSITIPDLECSFQDPESRTWTYCFPDWEMAKLYYLGYNGQRFLSQIPRLVVPSRLVQLQLHIALGLPVARDWARFFATMPRLRTLGIGGGALVAHALQAFEADPSLCPDLEALELCATTGRAVDEGVLAEFIPRVIGAWVRQRTRVGMGLSSLTVRTPAGGSGARAELGGGQGHGADLVGFASKLRQDLALLKGSVGEVLVETADCPACGVEYEYY